MSDRAAVEHRPPLGAHRLLGQGVGAALIRPMGEIDWWCADRFDSAPLLWSLLDANGGSAAWDDVEMATWDGHPAGPTAHTFVRHGLRRLHLWDGLITLSSDGSMTGEGTTSGPTVLIRLIRFDDDNVPATEGGADRARILRAKSSVTAVDGESQRITHEPLTMSHRLSAGGFDAPWQSWSVDVAAGGARSATLWVSGSHQIADDQRSLSTTVEVRDGEWTGLTISTEPLPDVCDTAALVRLMHEAEQDEHDFLSDVQLPRFHPSRILDALRVLRALTDADTGAQVASPTTSLPEAPGGERQYDYRYTWLRDSGHATATAALIGRTASSLRYIHFVADLLDERGDQMVPLFTTKGDDVPAEREVEGVGGWAASLPIRVGNEATGQVQIDSLASVIEAIGVHVRCGGRFSRRAWSVVDRMAALIVATPFEPTSGVWELREPALLVTDELARWVGLDKALRLQRWHRPWVRRPEWKRARAEARERVEAALDPTTGMLPQSFDGPFVADAATLLACINGFYPRRGATSRRLVNATIAVLEEGPFLRRYPPGTDGMPSVEGAFVPASWWAVSALAMSGQLRAATKRADEMCLHLPPLQPEEWNVQNDDGLGNTPLLWSHTEGARALYNLHCERLRHRWTSAGLALWRVSRYIRLSVSRGGGSHSR